MTPDLVLTGATVITLDPDAPPASAVAIQDGRVVAVGEDSICRDLRGPGTEVVDLHGATVTPGLVDSHTHPVMGLTMTDGVDLSACRDLDDVRRVLAEAEAGLPEGAWLTGWGLDPNVFGAAPLGYHALGAVAERRPTVLTLFDGHAVVASRRALELAGVDGPRTFGSRSEVVCDVDGAPTGHLLEEGAMNLVRAVMPEAGRQARLDALADLLDGMAATGLTGGHVMDLTDEGLDLCAELERSGRLPLRLRLAPWCRPDDDQAAWEGIRALQGRRGRLWTVAGVKMFMDGTIDGGTAWLHEADCQGQSTDAYWRDPQDYSAAVRFFSSSGIPTATHAIGDAAVTHVLDSVEALGEHRRGVRHRIEHIETLPSDQLTRFGQLDVVASMQPSHATEYTRADHSDNWSERLGDERANRGWRCRDLVDAGAVVALGSDWPIAPYDPRGVMAAGRSRRPLSRPELPPVLPEQGLTGLEALRGMTSSAAYAASNEGRAGRVAVGFDADLTVFAEDPTAVSADDLVRLPVLMTVVDGRVRHRSV
jgi:predicted amidohydrolase YtcJ